MKCRDYVNTLNLSEGLPGARLPARTKYTINQRVDGKFYVDIPKYSVVGALVNLREYTLGTGDRIYEACYHSPQGIETGFTMVDDKLYRFLLQKTKK